MSTKSLPRSVDHLVLPVVDVDIARARFEALGFTVAPTGMHPFGTENCCVFLGNDTFLEPLAIGHRETCEAAVLKGNTFVANDQTYRFRRGQEGFSHLVIKSDDVKADHKTYKKAAISAGKRVKFARKFETPDGAKGRASFRLAFAEDKRAPDAGFFSCEVASAPKVDRSALQHHTNGAASLLEVVMSEPNPSDFQYFLQAFLEQRRMDNHSFGIEFETQNVKVSVLSPDGMKAFYGMETEQEERGLRLVAYVIGVTDLKATVNYLKNNNINHVQIGPKVIVPAEPGQGCAIAFQEAGS